MRPDVDRFDEIMKAALWFVIGFATAALLLRM